jgi:hypothetical protein
MLRILFRHRHLSGVTLSVGLWLVGTQLPIVIFKGHSPS